MLLPGGACSAQCYACLAVPPPAPRTSSPPSAQPSTASSCCGRASLPAWRAGSLMGHRWPLAGVTDGITWPRDARAAGLQPCCCRGRWSISWGTRCGPAPFVSLLSCPPPLSSLLLFFPFAPALRCLSWCLLAQTMHAVGLDVLQMNPAVHLGPQRALYRFQPERVISSEEAHSGPACRNMLQLGNAYRSQTNTQAAR